MAVIATLPTATRLLLSVRPLRADHRGRARFLKPSSSAIISLPTQNIGNEAIISLPAAVLNMPRR